MRLAIGARRQLRRLQLAAQLSHLQLQLQPLRTCKRTSYWRSRAPAMRKLTLFAIMYRMKVKTTGEKRRTQRIDFVNKGLRASCGSRN